MYFNSPEISTMRTFGPWTVGPHIGPNLLVRITDERIRVQFDDFQECPTGQLDPRQLGPGQLGSGAQPFLF